MRAWLLDKFTGVAALRLADVPDPIPRDGEAVLRLDFAALNPADRYLAERQYPAEPALPHILGREATGTVVRAGPGTGGMREGDRRLILYGDSGVNRPGTFAERVACPAADLAEIPDGWSAQESAAARIAYLTAHQALTQWGPMPAKSVVLVTGASGGVGVAAVQLAAAMGHTVVALSRSEEKARVLRRLGAALTFNPREPSWRDSAKAALGPRRVALAVDNVGGDILPGVIQLLGDLGKVSVVGRIAGPVPSFNTSTLLFRRIRMGGVAVGASTRAETLAAWVEVLSLLARAGSRPQVDSIFPFEQLPGAFERLALGPMGKVLLKIE